MDSVTGINRDHGAEIFLDKDARKWSTKLTKDKQTIIELEKQITGLKSVTRAYVKVGIYVFYINLMTTLN